MQKLKRSRLKPVIRPVRDQPWAKAWGTITMFEPRWGMREFFDGIVVDIKFTVVNEP